MQHNRWLPRPGLLGLIIAIIMLGICFPAGALAHGGGTPRLTDTPIGPYRIFVWSQPEPLRAGEVHLTIGLTSGSSPNGDETADATAADSGMLVAPVTDATVTVRMEAVADPTSLVETTATVGGLGAVYYETDASLLTAGEWRFTIDVSGGAGQGTVTFSEELLPMRTVNIPLLVGGAALFVALIGLVGVWNRRQST